MRELLSEKGSIYVHIDWHVGHYVKILLDDIFGKDSFMKINSYETYKKGLHRLILDRIVDIEYLRTSKKRKIYKLIQYNSIHFQYKDRYSI